MSNERIDLLEERLAWLQRHIVEQDKAMMEMAGQLDRLKVELTRLKQRADEGVTAGGATNPHDERPPHY
jgi:SlyX protein